jgi:hypothetical protein
MLIRKYCKILDTPLLDIQPILRRATFVDLNVFYYRPKFLTTGRKDKKSQNKNLIQYKSYKRINGCSNDRALRL